MFNLFDELVQDNRLGTAVFSETILSMIKEDERVVALDADLCTASGLKLIREQAPANFVECGISEANMVGVAAGMSEAGIVPFTHTFAAFAARKCLDQIFLAGCFNRLNVKLIGTDPGLTAAKNGATHQGSEDMGALMGLPTITLLEASDCVMLGELLRTMKDTYGVFYLRTFRKESVSIYKPGSKFEIGKGNVLREGDDLTIIASGLEVNEALQAAAILEKEGIAARVVDMFTWKPLDHDLIERCARETGAIVTAENHQVLSGLGRAVSASVAANYPVPMELIGIPDIFGEVGDVNFLVKKFGLSSHDIASKARDVLARKRSLRSASTGFSN